MAELDLDGFKDTDIYKPELSAGRGYDGIREAMNSYPQLYEPGNLFHAVDTQRHPFRTPAYLAARGLETALVDDPEHAISLHFNPRRGVCGFYNGKFSLPERGLGIVLRYWMGPKITGRDYIDDEAIDGMLHGASITPLGLLVEGTQEKKDLWCELNRITLELNGVRVFRKDKRGMPTSKHEMARRIIPSFLHTSKLIREFKKKKERGLEQNGTLVDTHYGLRAVGITEDSLGRPWLTALDIQPGLIELILEYDRGTKNVIVYEVV